MGDDMMSRILALCTRGTSFRALMTFIQGADIETTKHRRLGHVNSMQEPGTQPIVPV